MTVFAESKEDLSIAHSSPAALPKLSGFPGGDCFSGLFSSSCQPLPAMVFLSFGALSAASSLLTDSSIRKEALLTV